jgi:hypothetical protein
MTLTHEFMTILQALIATKRSYFSYIPADICRELYFFIADAPRLVCYHREINEFETLVTYDLEYPWGKTCPGLRRHIHLY